MKNSTLKVENLINILEQIDNQVKLKAKSKSRITLDVQQVVHRYLRLSDLHQDEQRVRDQIYELLGQIGGKNPTAAQANQFIIQLLSQVQPQTITKKTVFPLSQYKETELPRPFDVAAPQRQDLQADQLPHISELYLKYQKIKKNQIIHKINYCHFLRKILVIVKSSKTIQAFNTDCQFQEVIDPNFPKEESNYLIDIAFDNLQQKIGVLIKGNYLGIFQHKRKLLNRRKLFRISKSLEEVITSLWFMEGPRLWITYNSEYLYFINDETQQKVSFFRIGNMKSLIEIPNFNRLILSWNNQIGEIGIYNFKENKIQVRSSVSSLYANAMQYCVEYHTLAYSYFSSQLKLLTFNSVNIEFQSVETVKIYGKQITALKHVASSPTLIVFTQNNQLRLLDITTRVCYQKIKVSLNSQVRKILFLPRQSCVVLQANKLVSIKLDFHVQKQLKPNERVVFIGGYGSNFFFVCTQTSIYTYNKREGSLKKSIVFTDQNTPIQSVEVRGQDSLIIYLQDNRVVKLDLRRNEQTTLNNFRLKSQKYKFFDNYEKIVFSKNQQICIQKLDYKSTVIGKCKCKNDTEVLGVSQSGQYCICLQQKSSILIIIIPQTIIKFRIKVNQRPIKCMGNDSLILCFSHKVLLYDSELIKKKIVEITPYRQILLQQIIIDLAISKIQSLIVFALEKGRLKIQPFHTDNSVLTLPSPVQITFQPFNNKQIQAFMLLQQDSCLLIACHPIIKIYNFKANLIGSIRIGLPLPISWSIQKTTSREMSSKQVKKGRSISEYFSCNDIIKHPLMKQKQMKIIKKLKQSQSQQEPQKKSQNSKFKDSEYEGQFKQFMKRIDNKEEEIKVKYISRQFSEILKKNQARSKAMESKTGRELPSIIQSKMSYLTCTKSQQLKSILTTRQGRSDFKKVLEQLNFRLRGVKSQKYWSK